MIFGHFTVYFKTVVSCPDRIVIVEDVVVTDYIGGDNLIPNVPTKIAKMNYENGNSFHSDVFVTASPMNSVARVKSLSNFRSVSGRLPKSLSANDEVSRMMRYVACDAVANFWGFSTDNSSVDFNIHRFNTQCYYEEPERRGNVLCFQEHQFKYQTASNDLTFEIRDAGHLGDKYPGIGKVWSGDKPLIQNPNSIVSLA